jgi:hypothetical protein
MSLVEFPTFPLARDKGIASASLCCDHCRGKFDSRVHRYWRMQFCCWTCLSAYQQRLSAETKQKIFALDVSPLLGAHRSGVPALRTWCKLQ